jgi:hypothetical protein
VPLAALLGWFDEHHRGGSAVLGLNPAPAPAALSAFADEVGPVATSGWSLHDGQARPTKQRPSIQGEPAKAKLSWLPGGYRWFSIAESRAESTSRFQRFTDGQRRVLWAGTNSFGAGLWVEADGTVVFRDREEYGPGRVLADDLEHFFTQYLERLNSGRVAYDAKQKAMVFGRKALLFAFG